MIGGSANYNAAIFETIASPVAVFFLALSHRWKVVAKLHAENKDAAGLETLKEGAER
jgi:hypothetical protein